MIGYFLPGGKAAPPREIPAFARVLESGPWSSTEFNHHEAGSGALLFWTDKSIGQTDLRRPEAWRKCADGLWYCRPAVLPDQSILAKRNCPQGIDVTLATGLLLTIPLATAAPRAVCFSSGSLGDPSSEFGRVADAVYDRMANGKDDAGKAKGLPLLDPQVLRLVTLALMAAYRVTPELLDDLGWITSADIDPILCAIMGTDPKAFEPAGVSSPLPAGA
ncbi:MAG TPA: hypothetical protein VGP44_01150 [Gemmatimonadales bacterium]|nr:hypothetical protein [Gemmatimonadales bacterium]